MWRDYQEGKCSDGPFYGFPHLSKWGIQASLSDKGFQPSWFLRWTGVLQQGLGKVTGLGFGLAQILTLLPVLDSYDLIFATVDTCALPAAMLKWCGLIRQPLVCATVGLVERVERNPSQPVWHFYRRILNAADRIVSYSSEETNKLQKWLQVPTKKVAFIPFGADDAFFQPLKAAYSTEGDFVLSVGADSRRDWKTLLEAVHARPLTLVLICNPTHLRDLDIPPNVQVRSQVPMTGVRDYYAQARLVVVPVQDATQVSGQRVLLEAMSMGKAVIMSRTAAVEGYDVQDGENCLLVSPGDVSELREAIQYLLANPEEARRIGENAHNTVEEKYSSRIYAARLAEVFREVYGERC